MVENVSILKEFIERCGIVCIFPFENEKISTIDLIDVNFHQFSEQHLKDIISESISLHANSKVSTAWNEIIESMKTTILDRQVKAKQHMEKLIQYGMEGNQLKANEYIRQLYSNGYIDHIFIGILDETLQECLIKNLEEVHMFQYFKSFITILKNNKILTHLEENVNNLKLNQKETIDDSQVLREEDLIQNGKLLNDLLTQSQGDVNKLKEKLLKLNFTNSYEWNCFKKVLNDNIQACNAMGYVNKLKVLKFIETTLTQSIHQEKQIDATNSTADTSEDNLMSITTTHHAPQFVNNTNISDASRSTADKLLTPQHILIEAPSSFIDALTTLTLPEKLKNNKKKTEKQKLKRIVDAFADKVGHHLFTHRWVVCDNFLPIDAIKRVRIEAGIFKNFYEQSEIWVGKQADVGAHLSVPSVRGDKVLWMCGGHSTAAPEGVSRAVRTIGELEPCKLDIKAAAPIRKFAAIRELVAAVDKLIDELKLKVDDVKGIYERSDVMLANYPSGGSRFANHIDNTTLDGRRLTVLVYLNPGWTAEQGGALRLSTTALSSKTSSEGKATDSSTTKSSANYIDVYPESGRIAIFYSSEVPHEVLPTFGDRHALTIWYYDTTERQNALRRAKESGAASETAKTSTKSQQEAKQFISDLMGGDQIGADGGNPSQEELNQLKKKVEKLSNETLSIVANITGSPSVDAFREGFPKLVPNDLKSMRRLFRSMGLQ